MEQGAALLLLAVLLLAPSSLLASADAVEDGMQLFRPPPFSIYGFRYIVLLCLLQSLLKAEASLQLCFIHTLLNLCLHVVLVYRISVCTFLKKHEGVIHFSSFENLLINQ